MPIFTPAQVAILTKSLNDFPYFVDKIFSESFDYFIRGEHVTNSARLLVENKKTMRICAKGHMKSTSIYAHFMWKLLHLGASNNIEGHYFSYQEGMAGYHVGKIKQLIKNNPYFVDAIDTKKQAENTIKFTWDRKHYTTLVPHGLLSFKRGLHGDLTYVDDPFQDPANELTYTTIYTINEVFKSQILDIPKMDGELHVIGTPQTRADFFFDKDVTSRFTVTELPAIKEGKVLWPEYMNAEELRAKKIERGVRIFEREYLCNPVHSAKAFFKKEYLTEKVVNINLNELSVDKDHPITSDVIAGFDIGKKRNPSHLSVFAIQQGKWIMIHEKWMDGWPYSNGACFTKGAPTQLEYLKKAIDNFKIDKLYYDHTRGEFEAFIEQGVIPPQMIPMVMTLKLKNQMATVFDKIVENEEMELLNHDRLINQICVVTNELKAVESKEGHADSFWSVGLALLGRKDIEGYYHNADNRKATVGDKSLFAENEPIPQGW